MAHVVYSTGTFEGSEGKVFYHQWLPISGVVKGVAVFVHGYVRTV